MCTCRYCVGKKDAMLTIQERQEVNQMNYRCRKLASMADIEFKLQCARLGLDYYEAIRAPMASIALALHAGGEPN